MARERRTGDATGDADDVVDRIEGFVVDRRAFLVGALAGGVSVGGVLGASTFTEGTRRERLAALAGGSGGTSRTTYHLPALDADGTGLVVDFSLELVEGTGDIYVNLDDVEVRHDIQVALREATVTAAAVADATPVERDVFVSFAPPGDQRVALRGKSWEAGLTVALVGALTGRWPSRRVLVTGVVGASGSLLPVGGVEAKAFAARAFGADVLLVPPSQGLTVPGIGVREVRDVADVAGRVLG